MLTFRVSLEDSPDRGQGVVDRCTAIDRDIDIGIYKPKLYTLSPSPETLTLKP